MKWHIEKRKLSELIPFEKNPRKFTEKGMADLKKSIDKFGIAEPIIVNTDNTIIGGHARFEAISGNGLKEVDVYVPSRELNLKEVKELNVRLNKNIAGEFDFDILANAFELPDLLGWGFEDKELDRIKFGIDTEEENEFEEPIKTKIKMGDKLQLGKHILICGDSETIPIEGDIDMIFTDPPYDLDKKILTRIFDNHRNINLQFWMLSDKQSCSICKLENNFNKYYIHDFVNATLINNNAVMGRHTLIAQFGKRSIRNLHQGFQSILSIPTLRVTKEHKGFRMGKRIELPLTFISHFAKGTVLDLFAGAGSTLLAAAKAGFQSVNIELNPLYCQLIIERFKKLYPNQQIELIK